MHTIQPVQAKKLVGRPIFAVKRDGSVVTGNLVRVKGDQLYVQS